MANDGMLVSESLLPMLEAHSAHEVLCPLLEGGGEELFVFNEVAELSIHSVPIFPGCFVGHWMLGDESLACLALVTRIVQLCAVDGAVDQGSIFVVLSRMPGILIGPGSFLVDTAQWKQFAADECMRVTTFVHFDDFCFTRLNQHTMDGGYLFMRE